MSSGLMSCVRENSPPLELDLCGPSGPLSLPEGNSRSHGYHGPTTSTPIASPVAAEDANSSTNMEHQHQLQQQQQQQQQQKRRRFHPLRNLRRIFRRRTINSADSAVVGATGDSSGVGSVVGPGSCNTLPPPASSSSEKNLRSVAAGDSLGASASSPASPLTHQQLHESYQTQSLPKSKSYGSHRDELLSVLLGKKRASKQQSQQLQSQPGQVQSHSEAMYQTQQRQQMGVAVFPDSLGMSRSSYFMDKRHHQRQLRSVGDSSQELNSGEDSGAAGGAVADMSDSQRSLSEGRLLDVDVDGDYTRETLSQSHDSVFSESATASSLSIVLKAELTDVLRKRRNRPDASDEDLGLPRSPASPQRHAAAGQSRKTVGYQSRVVTQGHEVSSLSLLSSNSTDGEDSSQSHRQLMCKSMSSDILRSHAPDEQVDGVSLDRQRLSHAAAKHKMAIRPAKKKGPSRHHRRTLESSIPEANEELAKFGQTQLQNPSLRAVKETDLKSKTRSLPPGSSLTATSNVTATATNSTSTSNSSSISSSHMRSKTIEQKKATTITTINSSSSTNINSNNKSEQHMTSTSSTSTTSSSAFGLRALTFKAANSLFDGRGESSTDGDDISSQPTDSDPGFLRRLMQRNSKRSIARANDGVEDLDATHNVAKKLQISTSCLEATQREPIPVPNKSKSATSHEQHIQETRQNIKREIQQEGKHGLNAMVSNYGVHPQPPTAVKPKSGPAARQRYLPQELAQHENTASDVTSLLSKQSRGNDTFQSTALVREQTQLKTTEIATTTSTTTTSTHFERKPRIVGLSAFQQKLSRSSDSMGQHSSSSNSLETSTDEPSPLYYEEKQRKMVEKSRSFRNYQEERESSAHDALAVHNNMPSLPDLSISFRVPASYYSKQQLSSPSPQSPMSPMSPMSPSAKCASLGFEINDNKLLQARAESTGKLPSPAKLSPQRSTTLLVSSPHPTPSASSTSISQIEQNIDLIVKSPLISVLRKSGAVNEQVSMEQQQQQPPQRPKVLELKQTTSIAIKEPKPASSPPSTPGKATTQAETQPEFMKIQLNRVDQARLHNKSNHLVLAKNVKSPAERSQSSDDLSMRRLSGDSTGSIQIVERSPTKTATPASPSPAAATTPHSISQQQRAVSPNSLRSSYVSSSSGSSAGSSELLAASPSTPKKPVEIVDSVQSNRFSLEERKRLFLNEDKAQTDRKLVELRYERKKSINEELQRKTETAAATPVSPISPVSPVTPVTPVSPGDQSNGNVVVLRKKSFASSNNGNSNSLTAAATPIAAAATSQEDGTPELMKVFARRSLKVKDDDAVAMAQVAVATHKKITNGSQSVDSDKENHSNSEEKLDKMLPKYEAQLSLETPRNHAQSHAPVQTQSSVSNRSSVADFRNLNNNQQPTGQKLANLPPIKVSNVRNNNTNVANNKANSQSHSPSVKSANERYSLQLKQATPATVAVTATATVAATVKSTAVEAEPEATPTKAIERSATVGEFKGILQRRAEWEQRVKEALK
ncbi:uncharacterized protein LOC133840145 [Drosophila sulfurigaster albostrigata]|uniref:uncharacterized protein LOC133840145 n=1 Tax=Drosophila sulfurigaster albostrigata TaxID=89887 RepID=UPI002D21D575|nr:uncharacterized protein LOC133840145 [Drosophila sulfurigaster albostrigata]XP_062127794.1 uncharacterized protein LOC133840145 [Drosophila sulfurigaster albostrigata]